MDISPDFYPYIVSEESFADKAVIFEEGGHSTWAYIILEGSVKVVKNTSRGKVTLFSLGKGEVVGEIALFSGKPVHRPNSVVANGPVTLGLLDSNRINEHLNAMSPRLRKYIATLAIRLGDAMGNVVASLEK